MASVAGLARAARVSPGEHGAVWSAPRRAAAIAAAATGGLASLALIAGALTPVPGGGVCTGACAPYPFDDPALVRDFVPVSFAWMIPAVGMLVALIVFAASLGLVRGTAGRLAGRLALAFTLVGASVLLVDYAVQLAVVAPSLLHGEGAAVVGLSLFNPHGVFVGLEDLGYWVLGLGFLGVASALGSASRPERIARWVFLVGGVLALAALPVLAAALGADLGYTYEIVVITVVDLTLAVGCACAAVGLARSPLGPRAADAQPAAR